jgi:putative heme degradation protein
MDAETFHSGRVAYSFPAGTFDLRASQSHLCCSSEEGDCSYVGLRPDWEGLFSSIRHLHVVLGAAAAGPLSVADTWEYPHFLPLPELRTLFDPDTGVEIRLDGLGSAIAVIDDHGSQQTASLQFFDLHGQGCLKIMLTNFSDLTAFERLLKRYACPLKGPEGRIPRGREVSRSQGTSQTTAIPELAAVWQGSCRTRPGTKFAGLGDIQRKDVLRHLADDDAWCCTDKVVPEVLQTATLTALPLAVSVQNEATYFPAVLTPSHWHPCPAGLTFFSPYAQVTLREGRAAGEIWTTRGAATHDEALLLEMFDTDGSLYGTLGAAPGASDAERHAWNKLVLEYHTAQR